MEAIRDVEREAGIRINGGTSWRRQKRRREKDRWHLRKKAGSRKGEKRRERWKWQGKTGVNRRSRDRWRWPSREKDNRLMKGGTEYGGPGGDEQEIGERTKPTEGTEKDHEKREGRTGTVEERGPCLRLSSRADGKLEEGQTTEGGESAGRENGGTE